MVDLEGRDNLPEWAAEAHSSSNIRHDRAVDVESDRPRRRWLIPVGVLGALAALFGTGVAGYMLAQSDDPEVSATDDTAPAIDSSVVEPASPSAEETAADATDGDGDGDPAIDPAEAASDGETGAMADDTDGDGDDGGGGGDAADADGPASVDPYAEDSISWAVFKGGQVFLRGRVSSEEEGQEVAMKAGLVVGPENVFNEYEVDPSVARDNNGPLYVEDVILFEFNSVEIREPFLQILDLGTLLMTQNPNVEIVVVGRTDATGSEETNQEVSEERAQALVDYWVGQGIDPDRLSIDARGESEASGAEDDETAAFDRRAEFIISGLLD